MSMKDWVVKKIKAVTEWAKTKVMPKIEALGPVAQIAAVVGLVVGGLVVVAAVIALAFCLAIVLPGMIIGGLLWIGWVYLEIGSTYFPQLDPVWFQISYWQFTFASAALIFFLKILRRE